MSFFNQLVLASIFGAGSELDAYLVAISLPLTLVGLFSGVLSYQVVPALRREENTTGSSEASLRAMIWGLGGGAAVVALTGALLSPWLVPLLAPALQPVNRALAIKVSTVAWGWLPLAVIGAVLTGGLHVRQKFTAATLLQPLPVLGAMIGCLVLHMSHGVLTLAWGQTAGYIVMVLAMFSSLRLKLGPHSWTQIRGIIREAPLALAALLFFVFYPFSDAIWGALAGSAGVSLLGYAQRLVVGFAGIAVVGASTVLFPRLAQQAAAGNQAALRDDLGRTLRTILACMAPASAFLGVLALPIVQVIFVRGAFDLAQAHALAALLPWMFAGMIAMSGMALTFKALFAQGRVREAAAISICGAAVYFVLSGLFARPFGLPGIGAAYALSWWLVLFLSGRMLLNDRTTNIDFGFALRVFVITGLCAFVAWAGKGLLHITTLGSQTERILALGCTTLIAVSVFFTACLLWPGMAEISLLVRRLRTREAD